MKNRYRHSNSNVPDKIYRKVHSFVFSRVHDITSTYPLYKSYRHIKHHQNGSSNKSDLYLTQEPNHGAGIGHQLSNWNAGYWFAHAFGIKYAYSSLPNEEWDRFFGLGDGEITAKELLRQGYRKVRLPYYDERDSDQMKIIQRIVDSYSNEKVVFYNELDQSYTDQYGVAKHLQEKFYHAPEREKDQLLYKRENLNIAIHIRRGDIGDQMGNVPEQYQNRWMNDSYYERLIRWMAVQLKDNSALKPKVFIFTEGESDDYRTWETYGIPIEVCNHVSAKCTMLHFIFADILVTSKSSFSYKPALINTGLKIVPNNFWHHYPKNDEWITVDDDGAVEGEAQRKILNYLRSKSE